MSEQQNELRGPPWTVQDRLRKAREHAGLEQSELAELIGVGRTTIGNYERGVTPPRRPVLLSWAMATGVSLEWLVDGQPDGQPTTPKGSDGGFPTFEYADTSDERDNRALPFVHMTSQEAA